MAKLTWWGHMSAHSIVCATIPFNMSSSLSHHHLLYLLWLSAAHPQSIHQAMISSSIKRQTAKGFKKEFPFLENKINFIFNMIILNRSKCYYTVLLQQYFNTGLFRVLLHVMMSDLGHQIASRCWQHCLLFSRYSRLAEIGYSSVAGAQLVPSLSQLLAWLGLESAMAMAING